MSTLLTGAEIPSLVTQITSAVLSHLTGMGHGNLEPPTPDNGREEDIVNLDNSLYMSDEHISDTEDEDDNGKLIAGAINGMLSTGKPDRYHREQDDFQSSSLPLGTNINKK